MDRALTTGDAQDVQRVAMKIDIGESNEQTDYTKLNGHDERIEVALQYRSCILKFRGAGLATLITAGYQLCHIAHIITIGRKLPRAPVSLDYCPENERGLYTPINRTFSTPSAGSEETFFMFRLSHLWSGFFCILATIIIGVLISAVIGEINQNSQRGLCSDAVLRIWAKLRSQPYEQREVDGKRNNPTESNETCNAERTTLMTSEMNSTV